MNMNLKLTDINGESVNDGHAGEIDVLAWSWGASNSGTMHVSTGGGAGKANVQDLSITKYIDKASADLAKACISGKHIDQGILTIKKAGGDKPVDYLVITLDEILVSSVSTGGTGGEDRLTENVSLNFAKVKMEYKVQDKKGAAQTGGKMAWDIAKNVAA
jgi:type VI secretion system secreted protein Hcp